MKAKSKIGLKKTKIRWYKTPRFAIACPWRWPTLRPPGRENWVRRWAAGEFWFVYFSRFPGDALKTSSLEDPSGYNSLMPLGCLSHLFGSDHSGFGSGFPLLPKGSGSSWLCGSGSLDFNFWEHRIFHGTQNKVHFFAGDPYSNQVLLLVCQCHPFKGHLGVQAVWTRQVLTLRRLILWGLVRAARTRRAFLPDFATGSAFRHYLYSSKG